MKAIRIHQFGSVDVMQLDQVERPVPQAGQVLVQVRAAGVGPWDAWVRAGKSVLDQPLPLTLGSDIAGVVVQLGPDVRGLSVGDEVYGVTNPSFTGGYAEYAIAQADMIAPKPRVLSFVQAAAVPVVAVTAQQMLFEHARLLPGQRVLVHGAAGSVGACALQLAAAAGAGVVGTVLHALPDSTQGAVERIIDNSRERFEDSAGPVDVVIDTVGGEVQSRSLPVLKPGGILVSSVAEPNPEALARLGVRGTFMLVNVQRPALEQIARAIDDGQLSVRVGTVCKLEEAAVAHSMLEGRVPHAPGKIVLCVDG